MAVTQTTPGTRRRGELAAFLRSRRERITPDDLGMPPGPRRRTPGLRREEVAQLAGVGVTWYTWLEQGRPINVSMQVLEAVARTLRLDAAEREHLYRLADVPADDHAPAGGDSAVPEELSTILDALHPLPASVVNSRHDILAWNAAYAAMFPYVVRAPASERNSLWMVFTLPGCCNPVPDVAAQAPLMVAIFRQAYSRHLHEPGWKELVRRLSAASPEFARQWAAHDVANPGSYAKRYRHPAIGEISIRTSSFDVTGVPETRMIVYTPGDDRAREALDWLIAHPTAAEPGHRH